MGAGEVGACEGCAREEIVSAGEGVCAGQMGCITMKIMERWCRCKVKGV